MAASFFVACALAPLFGGLATPLGGGGAIASLPRTLAFACEAGILEEQRDPFDAFSVGYNLDLKLADTRLSQAGVRMRFQPHPAWGKEPSQGAMVKVLFGASYVL